MIPADVASRLQTSADTVLRPVAPTQEISDKLSDLVVGQRVMAEITALLPNGTYRALINQRNITLALPFSARSGDTLELQVTESDGKVALAVISHEGESAQGASGKAAVSATLSRTGQFISQLLSDSRETGSQKQAAPVPLNGNQAIANGPSAMTSSALVPLLRQALTESGMFYEAHQAEWIEGRFAKNALLQEPQGKLSSPIAFQAPQGATETAEARPSNANNATTTVPPSQAGVTLKEAGQDVMTAKTPVPGMDSGHASSSLVAPQTQPIVQHQLEALASQNFSWQGQIWPNQEMRWEIEEDAHGAQPDDQEPAGNWQTRLHLILPLLGNVDARIRLSGDQVIVAINTGGAGAAELMQSESESLRQGLTRAGIAVTSLSIGQSQNTEKVQDGGETPA
ncbi:flagellar hook-length control protein FliK [Propionivibrio soli]|uniref:flagellar hook-length control protein FliK n=1 Tax=Propionivibrio soli TaxID=2976531 RepID=UPI0021E6E8CA|nr:flagellar hook-length control protein FliK [Propionivibrio soli]